MIDPTAPLPGEDWKEHEPQDIGAGPIPGGNGQVPHIDWNVVEQHAGWLKTADDLPEGFNAKGRMIVAHRGSINDLNEALRLAGLSPKKPYKSLRGIAYALASIFKQDTRLPLEQIAAALLCKLDCNKYVTTAQASVRHAIVEQLLLQSYNPTGEPNWRERRVNGSPLPSMYNARLAITALGIKCSFDTFHNKILFGFCGDTVQHEIQNVLGEVTDHGIICLRHIMSEKFSFETEDKVTRDAVMSLALEHCFNPVADMLDKAEASWDGVERLDRMAHTHFNCANTKLNRAFGRKTMIGAVRRVRQPGCKFDNIFTLESKEGWNKSSAWRVLAGDENFSDEKIIGKNSREVQEQLSEIWIHENADLAGMRKTDVETVKAFASRQVDIARSAYGHFVKKQKRHSIEVGTTNGDEYLLSQTGNRRFWPAEIFKSIDLDLIQRDRLQLWGEAAKYESSGESITLDEALWSDAEVEQEERRAKDPWEDIVADIPQSTTRGDADSHVDRTVQLIYCDDADDVTGKKKEKVASTDLLQHLLNVPIAQQKTEHSMRLSNVMKRAGWTRDANKVTINGKQVRGYWRWMIPPDATGTDTASTKQKDVDDDIPF
jgi:predicted P-loop ATPase